MVADVFGSLAPDCLALLLCGFTLYSRLKANEVFFMGINAIQGYPQIAAFSPLEVIRYEDEEV